MIDAWSLAPHFQQLEFDSPDAPGSGTAMKPELLVMLEALRRLIGKPLVINSGVRTLARNHEVGGAPASAHLTGEAVDIGTRGWSVHDRNDLIIYARKLGFNGVGIASNYIHIDMKSRVASWAYRGGKVLPIPLGNEARHL